MAEIKLFMVLVSILMANVKADQRRTTSMAYRWAKAAV